MSETQSLIASCYQELRRLASRELSPGVSVTPTDLVHEVYMRLRDREWEDERHFRRTAARAMRQVLVDRARRRTAAKRGGEAIRVTLTGLGTAAGAVDVIAVDRALAALHAADPRRSEVAELILFGGFSQEEVAEQLEVSVRTVKRDWRIARAFLASELEGT